MGNWGISSTANEKEKLKAEYSDLLHGLNACGNIDYKTYNELWDVGMLLFDRMYDLGLMDSKSLDKESITQGEKNVRKQKEI